MLVGPVSIGNGHGHCLARNGEFCATIGHAGKSASLSIGYHHHHHLLCHMQQTIHNTQEHIKSYTVFKMIH